MTALSLMSEPPGLNPFDPIGAFLKSLLSGDGEFGSCRVRDGWVFYQITADLPGFIQDDFHVFVRDGQLVINARSSCQVLSSQRPYTKILPLPAYVDASHILYSYERGKLTVKIPKHKRSFLF